MTFKLGAAILCLLSHAHGAQITVEAGGQILLEGGGGGSGGSSANENELTAIRAELASLRTTLQKVLDHVGLVPPPPPAPPLTPFSVTWNGAEVQPVALGQTLSGPAATWYYPTDTMPDFLKEQFPMLSTPTINEGNAVTLTLNARTKVYMIRRPSWQGVSLDGWNHLSRGYYLYTWGDLELYEKTFEAGTYQLDNFSAMYLFARAAPDGV